MTEDQALDTFPLEVRAKLRKTRQPAWFMPMLATLTEQRFSHEGWVFEPKLDGERCLVFRNAREPALYPRNEKLLNSKIPRACPGTSKTESGERRPGWS